MSQLIEVAFKGNRKDFFLWDSDDPPPVKAAVIVDADRGEDLGFVYASGELAQKRNAGTPHGYGQAGTTKRARRLATTDEVERANELRDQDEDARRRAMERVKSNDLAMKLSDAEWQWDRKKLTLYFTADKRVDFRTLVRELASMFRTRIELKQIGVRDEAKRLDGIGRCGRQYCSASWLPELRPVNLGVAKDQRLSLNPSQISGACGRLMCCLRYEHEFYVQSRKRFPKEGRVIKTKRGEEKVISNDIFRERVTLRGEDGEVRTILLIELREEAESVGAPLPAVVAATAPAVRSNADDEDEGELASDDDTLEARTEETEPDVEAAQQTASPGEPGERRPHRRRGRRGGRRNRQGSRGPRSDSPDASSSEGYSNVAGDRFYLTTAIDYANGDPHIGHAYEKIGADVIARYHRLCGKDVSFLTGLDEHGQKVAQAAVERGVSPQEFVDEIATRFEAMWSRLSISFDRFMRTTEPGHKRGVRALIKRIHDNNPDDFYEKSYEGWYCVGCELFKRDNEIVDGKCVLHPTRTLEWTTERNWFFRLTRYEGFLRNLFEERPNFLGPETRRNEVLALLDQGLEDISITRSRLSWAIPFPLQLSTGEEQGTWVWFDALPNYLTATGFPDKEYKSRWPAQLHVIGKDITRLHCVIWPAMLQAAELPLPERVWAHGFVLLSGERFSKSSGVRLDVNEAIDRFGADALRYFLMREVPFDADGSFSYERFDDRYNADLANSLGNLASRAISMVEKYFDGVVPSAPRGDLDRADMPDIVEYHAAMDGRRGFLLHEGLKRVMSCVGRGNEFVQASQPWALAKNPERRGELEAVLASIMRQIARHAIHLAPFMPNKAQELWMQLGGPGRVDDQRFSTVDALDVAGWRVAKGASLFPKPLPTP